MDFKDIISKQISWQPNAWSPLEKEVSIADTIKEIKKGKYFGNINALRKLLDSGNKEKYDINKKRLPAVTFCGSFEGARKKEKLKSYNKLIVIDIDKLDSVELERVKQVLSNEDFVFSFWVSPSNNGLKGLVALEFNKDVLDIDIYHKIAFVQLSNYFRSNYQVELDSSGSDTTRLCFLSSDAELIFKTNIKAFPVDLHEKKLDLSLLPEVKKEKPKKEINYTGAKDILLNPAGKNNYRNKKTIQKIIKFLKKNKLSITENYEDWYRIAYAIANSFTHDIGEKYYLQICEQDGGRHDEFQSRNMLLYCYQNSHGDISFKTLVFMAVTKGYII